ncbi:hypothetical protein K435DRAFT_864271 [Dendrothele bispora CBS 962.96]|uniref:Uncharacterized protein n=1 Tax=Dendrothele bispora (strain CBS 962.96) TaxID=1314807 RepID=A0A4S8LMD2_DENBC|nr:hypothetical protein K435DRAFT_864271 [Dendrothele bispora CBS 962.96]
MSTLLNTIRLCVIEDALNAGIREAHNDLAIVCQRSVEIVSRPPTTITIATDELQSGDIDGIIISCPLVGRLMIDNVHYDAASLVVDGFNLVKKTGDNLYAMNLDVFGVHYAVTSTCAYPRFRAVLLIGNGSLVRAALYSLVHYFQSDMFYVFEESDKAFTDLYKFIQGLSAGITVIRHTDVTSSPAVSCVITDIPKDVQLDDRVDQQTNIFLNLGFGKSGHDLTPWSFLALRSGWEEISLDSIEKFQTYILWQQIAVCDNNLIFHEDSWCVTSTMLVMAPPESLICVVVNLAENWSIRASVPFARTYNHTFTVDDLLLDEWFPPPSDSLFRKGVSSRRLFCTRWRLGRNTSLLPNPYTFLFKNNTLDLRTGMIVVVKHVGFGTDAVFMVDCSEEDVEVVQQVVINYGVCKLKIPKKFKQYTLLLADRRFAAGNNEVIRFGSKLTIQKSTGCHCGLCAIPNELFRIMLEPSDMATLARFSRTCRYHHKHVVRFMDHRVNKTIRKLIVPGFIEVQDIKEILRSTNAIIHGLAALLSLLPDDIATPDNIEIATPFGTRNVWAQLFARVPHLPTYHLWDSKISVDGLQLVRASGVFFLPNNVAVTIQESFFDSAMPILLSHPTTALCCGISYGIVFAIYPYHIKNRMTDRVFEK